MNKPERKTPVRQCMGCREHKPKNQLCRVVRSPQDEVSVDNNGKKPGRGVYLCKSPECLKRVKKSRALERNLKAPVGQEIYDSIQAVIENGL